jgi:hypothetical protein
LPLEQLFLGVLGSKVSSTAHDARDDDFATVAAGKVTNTAEHYLFPCL